MKKNDLLTRRELFRRAAKALPVLLISCSPVVQIIASQPSGCNGDCTATCANECTKTCSQNCTEDCRGTCKGLCARYCTGGCIQTCTGTCCHNCFGSCTLSASAKNKKDSIIIKDTIKWKRNL